MLIPFFTHRDLLRLSECSKTTMGYRHHLSHLRLAIPTIGINEYGGGSQEASSHLCGFNHDKVIEGLTQLMASQERGGEGKGLDCLVIDDYEMLDVFTRLVGMGSCCRVKKLDLCLICSQGVSSSMSSSSSPGDVGETVETLLLSGAWGCIEDLCVGADDASVTTVLGALGRGVCPNLRRLSIRKPSGGSVHALVSTLRSGHCHHLQELVFIDATSAWFNSDDDLQIMFQVSMCCM